MSANPGFPDIFSCSKSTHLKTTLVIVCAMLYSVATFATGEWKSYFKNNEVEILYRYSDCHDEHNGIHQQKILFRFVNLTGKEHEVIFSREYTYNNSSKIKADKSEFSVKL